MLRHLKLHFLLVTVAAISAPAVSAQSFSTFTDRASLNGNDILRWNKAGPCNPDVFLSNPVNVVSDLGVQVQVSQVSGNAQVRIEHMCLFAGDFAVGEVLYYNNGGGAVTLSFNPPVYAAGANLMTGWVGPFTGRLTAYNGNTVLGVMSGSGYTSGTLNTAAFWGVAADAGITKVEFQIDTCAVAECSIITLNQISLVSPEKVTIDVKPGSDSKIVNTKSKGKLQLAILSSASLDAVTAIDTASLTFGRTGTENSVSGCAAGGDVNGDQLPDLVCDFSVQAAAFQPGDTTGTLQGKKTSGVPILGVGNLVAK